uniref:Uncharacterized protein n=1 Tax=Anopheles dirus TaxID=7168 RepID=A0A182NLD5_9DIPT
MPKPLPAALPRAPWDIVPPAQPHPAAAVLPVPVQPWAGGESGHTARRHQLADNAIGSARQDAADSDSRKSRRVSEFYRFLRALSPTAEPSPTTTVTTATTRQSSATVVQRLNLPGRENSAIRDDARDYLIEPIDKNKSQSVRVHARFDDTNPPRSAAASGGRARREAVPAATSHHRHQHQLGPGGPTNSTGVWHGRRGRHHQQQQQQQQSQQQQQRNNESNLERNERSANLSHISGATRKIQLFIKNRYIQLLPDGTVNGTHDDLSDYSEYPFRYDKRRICGTARG